jgi:hypothetical protein
MLENQRRQYLQGTPKDLQDLIYDKQPKQALQLLMQQRNIGKLAAMMELGQLAGRMKNEFPNAIELSEPTSHQISGTKSALIWILLVLFILISSGMTFFGVRGLVRAKSSVNWPTTQGNITRSKVDEVRDTGGHDGLKETVYHARISYLYTVDGKDYMGKRVAYGDHGTNHASGPRATVRKYPVGTTTKVFYMQDNPDECLLEPGIHGQAFVLPGIGIFILSISLLVLWAMLSRHSDKIEHLNTAEHPNVGL